MQSTETREEMSEYFNFLTARLDELRAAAAI
jgi:hypothetical protein